MMGKCIATTKELNRFESNVYRTRTKAKLAFLEAWLSLANVNWFASLNRAKEATLVGKMDWTHYLRRLNLS